MSEIDTITQVINNLPRGENNSLTLKPGDFKLPDVALFFSRALGNQSLTIGQAGIQTATGSVSVHGSMELLGYTGLQGTITFQLVEEELQIVLKGEFAVLKKVSPPLLNWLSLEKLVIMMTFTSEFGILATQISGEIVADPARIPITISLGASENWSIEMTGPGVPLPDLNRLAALVGGEQIASFFPKTLVDVIKGITVGGIGCQFNTKEKTVSYFTVTFTVTNGWDIVPKISLKEGLTLNLVLINPVGKGNGPRSVMGTLRGQGEINGQAIPFFVQGNAGSSTNWSVGVFPEDKIVLPSFSDILSLGGGQAFLDTLPDSLKDIPSLAVYKLQIDFDPVNKTLDLISFSLGTASAWNVLEGYFAINNLSIDMDITDVIVPEKRCILGTIYASFQIADVFVQISLSRASREDDWVLSGGLPPGRKLNLTDIAGKLFKGNITIPADAPVIAFDDLNLRVTPKTKLFSFTAGSQSPWEIIRKKLSINKFHLQFTRDPARTPNLSGTISTVLTISAVDISLEATLNDADKEGWQFTGKTGKDQKIPIGELITFITDKFNVASPPDWIRKASLQDLSAIYNTKSKDFSFGVTATTTLLEKDLALKLGFSLVHLGEEDYRLDATGELAFGTAIFTLDLSRTGSTTTMSGSWTAKDKSAYLNLADILKLLGLGDVTIPAGLDLGLRQIVLSYDFTDSVLVMEADSATYNSKALFAALKNESSQWQFFFAMNAFAEGKGINLSNLPVIDKYLSSADTLEIQNLKATISLAEISKDFAAKINKLIRKGYPTVPDAGLPEGASLSMEFNFGGKVIPLNLGTSAKQDQTPALSAAPAVTAVATRKSSDGSVWFNVQKSFGPVTFGRVGARYRDSVLWFLLDASLSLSGLTVSVMGLAVGSPLTTFKAHFDIEGLGVDYKNSAVEIAGAFLKFTPSSPDIGLEFGGGIVVKAANFSIQAAGAYAELKNPSRTSLFIFASVTGNFGGPPYFFVTGFSGGLGYNSHLRLPGMNEVFQFPFVAGLSNPATLGGPGATPLDALKKIMGDDPKTAWVTPQAGEIWLAAGIQFTTCELINSTAMLIAQFGNDFSLALVGLSRARFPKEGPVIYAFVELQLEAVFKPSEGVITFTAVLSPNSYVLDPACHLTGGFAMYFWFGKNEHAGDFVLTLGGYSPYFSPPAWYPRVPRLGFNWPLDSKVSITGGVYFALTPAAVMAGGSLEVKYHSGNLKAWFTAHADIIVWWNPFRFIAGIGISVGASYKVNLLFTSKTFKVELGADLTLWGPPTGGTVTVHWWVISFTVDFGSSDPRKTDQKQEWSEFSAVLPAKKEAVKIVALEGLNSPPATRQDKSPQLTADAPAEAEKWLVRSDKFSFTTNSAIPSQDLFVGKDSSTIFRKGDALNIRPMQAKGLNSHNRLYIMRADGTEVNLFDKDETWTIEPNTANVPTALWGTGSNAQLPAADKQLVPAQLTGFTVSAPVPKEGYTPGSIDREKGISYSPVLPPGTNPLKSGLSPSGPVPGRSSTTLADIAGIMSSGVSGNRGLLFTALGGLGIEGLVNGSLTLMAEQAGSSFTDVPLEITGQAPRA